MIRVICQYCHGWIVDKPGAAGGVSHGTCASCVRMGEAKQRERYIETLRSACATMLKALCAVERDALLDAPQREQVKAAIAIGRGEQP